MKKYLFEIKVTAKLGYFSIYKIDAEDVHQAKIEAVDQFMSDFGAKEREGIETYCFNPHQKYADDHAGEPIVTVD